MSSEKSAPPQYASPPPPQGVAQPGHPGQSGQPGAGNPQYVLVPKDQGYVAPLNQRPLQAGHGDPQASNPECKHYGHDTHIGCGGITFLVCCFPWSMIW